jgi:hypothetical protein
MDESLCHDFRVQFQGIISQFCCRDSLQAMASLWKIRISLYPLETVHVSAISRFILSLVVLLEPDLIEHVYSINGCSLFDKWPIEEVSIIGCDDGWTNGLDVIEEMSEHSLFIGGVYDRKWTFKFGLGSVIEIVDIGRNNFAISDEETLPIRGPRNKRILGRQSCMRSS